MYMYIHTYTYLYMVHLPPVDRCRGEPPQRYCSRAFFSRSQHLERILEFCTRLQR